MPLVAEARERSGRSAQLRRQPLSGDLLESHARLDDRGEPAGGLEAERRRHGVLQERSGDHQRLAVLASRALRLPPPRRRLPRARARAPAGRRASRPCRRCPGSSRRGARDAPPPRRPSPPEREREARRGCRRRGLRPRAARSRSARGRRRSAISAATCAGHRAGGRPGVRERPLGVEHCLEPRPG